MSVIEPLLDKMTAHLVRFIKSIIALHQWPSKDQIRSAKLCPPLDFKIARADYLYYSWWLTVVLFLFCICTNFQTHYKYWGGQWKKLQYIVDLFFGGLGFLFARGPVEACGKGDERALKTYLEEQGFII